MINLINNFKSFFENKEKKILNWIKEHDIKSYELIQKDNEFYLKIFDFLIVQDKKKFKFPCKVLVSNNIRLKDIEYVDFSNFPSEVDYLTINNCNISNLDNFHIKVNNLDLNQNNISELPEHFKDFSFNNFFIKLNSLTSLKNFPHVYNSLDISNNNITSLKGVSEKLLGSFNCSHNPIKVLDHCPNHISELFICNYTDIHQIIKLPEFVGKTFYFIDNKNLKLSEIYSTVNYIYNLNFQFFENNNPKKINDIYEFNNIVNSNCKKEEFEYLKKELSNIYQSNSQKRKI